MSGLISVSLYIFLITEMAPHSPAKKTEVPPGSSCPFHQESKNFLNTTTPLHPTPSSPATHPNLINLCHHRGIHLWNQFQHFISQKSDKATQNCKRSCQREKVVHSGSYADGGIQSSGGRVGKILPGLDQAVNYPQSNQSTSGQNYSSSKEAVKWKN